MSLRNRLLLALAAAVVVALAIVATSTYVLVARSQIGQVDDDLDSAAPAIAQAAADGDRSLDEIRELAPGLYVELRDDGGSSELVVPLRDRDGSVLRLDGIDVPAPGAVSGDATFVSATADDEDDQIRLRVSRQDDGSLLLLGKSLEELYHTRERLLGALVATGLGAVVAAVVLGAWLVRAGLRPLHDVELAASAIGDDDLGRRVPADGPSEVGQLAQSINGMLDRLEHAVDQREQDLAVVQESEARMRRFVADASHELRTPLAATAAYAELFERGARDRPDDLDRAMAGIRRETARMAELVDDLMLLARLDEGRPLEHGVVDLCDVVATAVDTAMMVDPDRRLSVRFDDVAFVDGDAGRLRQVVDNLLGNVRMHTPSQAACEVVVAVEGGHAVLTIRDEGPGMSPADAERAFDRFHRADASRTRASGGSGLGLAIVAAVADAHGGSASLESEPGVGTTVRLRLPLAADATDDPSREREETA